MTAAGFGAADRVLKTGDSMSGTLVLNGNPPISLPAGTSGYLLVCDAFGNLTLSPPVSGAPTGSASGDLTGSYPGPTVSGITGVAVSGTPTAGNTLVVQSGGTSAHWQAPAGGAPSGSASGDLSGSYPGPTVAGIEGIPISGSAVAGNTLVVGAGATSLGWSTPAAGVTLDSLAAHLQPDAVTAVAGSIGEAADSGHQHPGSNVIGGVTVSGTPASGKTIIASTSSAAAWTTPAVTLDTTASDIAVLAASAVAGSVGKAADSGHQHPYTGLALLSGAAFTGNVSTTGTLAASKALTAGVVALTDASTISVNAALGNTFRVTLGGNRTMGTPSNPADGQMVIFEITQGLAGTYTLAWSGAYLFTTGLPAPTITTTAGYVDICGFKYAATPAVWRCLAVSQGYSA
jgi:hypothetical protein